MKQVVQNYKTGELKTQEVPYPSVKERACIVKTKSSLISAGTERTKIETAKMSLIEKAISRLDLVKTVFNNIKQEGVVFTFKKAFNKLNTPISLGYSCAGEIVQGTKDLEGFEAGDRVACIGEEYAAHADYNNVPIDHMTKIPGDLSYEEAAFVGLGAIAINPVHIAQIREGEKVAVIGLGLLGQIVVQILKAKGCGVLGIEIDESKIAVAKELGMDAGVNPLRDDIEAAVNSFSSGAGVDGVIITAASKNNMPIETAGKISRNKGRVILVGAMPILLPREDYYSKELTFIISRGFGADIYYKEPVTREYAFNYKPITMKQNMDDFLLLIAKGKVNISKLITHRFKLDDANKAYSLISNNSERYLGIMFDYSMSDDIKSRILNLKENEKISGEVNVGFIGAGSFAQGYILPVLRKRKDVNLKGVATSRGISSRSAAEKFDFDYCSTDYNEILNDEFIDTVFITTRHDLHAEIVIKALEKGKNVFVEKPLCLNNEELEKIKNVYKPGKILMVGFNRRFSPFIKKAKEFFVNRVGPLMITYRVNAGFLPGDHWLHASEGGGRVIGEGCHFFDLMNYLTASKVRDISALNIIKDNEMLGGNFNVTISYEDGSIANIQYSSIGDVSFSRERLEIFGENSAAIVDNYKNGDYSRKGILDKIRKIDRDMGHENEVNGFIDNIRLGKSLIPFEELLSSTELTLKIGKMLNG